MMAKAILLGGLAALALLVAADAPGGAERAASPAPAPSADLPPELARRELCAAAIEADGRSAARRLAAGDDAGAGFAARNDAFRADWLVQRLREAAPDRDWRARLDALAARLPDDRHAAGLARLYGECLDEQNREPTFTAALHAWLPYVDAY